MNFTRTVATLLVVFCLHPLAAQTAAQKPKTPTLPSETPAKFEPDQRRLRLRPPRGDDPDARRREAAHRHPRAEGRGRRAPILLTRTPYDADGLTTHANSAHLGPSLYGYDNATDVIVEGGYIRVVQDVRGKYGSEGDYVMNRPLRGPLNPTPVDHATDTYDTIDWLVKNVPETNGKVGILGISYDGFLPLMALVDPHPALEGVRADEPDGRRLDGRRLVPQRRVPPAEHALHLRAGRDAQERERSGGRATSTTTTCSCRPARPASWDAAAAWSRSGSGASSSSIPAYDAFWREQAVDKILGDAAAQGAGDAGAQPLGSGGHLRRASPSTRRIEPKDTDNDKVFLVIGPWHHGQEIEDGSTLGALKFDSDTALTFRREHPRVRSSTTT